MAKLDDLDDKPDRRVMLRLNEREDRALRLLAADMQLSRADAIRSLILTTYHLEPKLKPKKRSTLNHG